MIYVLSRKSFLILLDNGMDSLENCAIISIYSSPPEKVITESKSALLNSIGCNHLSLCFEDVSVEGHPGLITKEQATEIFTFLKKFRYSNKLMVHCDAGISRSGAVGFFACRYYGLNELEFIKNNPYIYPNPYIFDLLYTISGMKKDYENDIRNLFNTKEDFNTLFSCDTKEKIIGLFSKRHQGYKQADGLFQST